MPDDDEPPTMPDLRSFPCPACRDDLGVPTGAVVVEVPGEVLRSPCDTCWGKRVVDRAAMRRWRARQP